MRLIRKLKKKIAAVTSLSVQFPGLDEAILSPRQVGDFQVQPPVHLGDKIEKLSKTEIDHDTGAGLDQDVDTLLFFFSELSAVKLPREHYRGNFTGMGIGKVAVDICRYHSHPFRYKE